MQNTKIYKHERFKNLSVINMYDDIMAIVMDLKETIKTLVLAPAVGFLSYVATNIITGIAIAVGAFTSGEVGMYPVAVAGIAFAIVLILGIEGMIK